LTKSKHGNDCLGAAGMKAWHLFIRLTSWDRRAGVKFKGKSDGFLGIACSDLFFFFELF